MLCVALLYVYIEVLSDSESKTPDPYERIIMILPYASTFVNNHQNQCS